MSDRDDTDDLSAPPQHDTLLRRVAQRIAPPIVVLEPGTGIGERYEIIRAIGAGGMGEVYLARDVTLERDVAIKLCREGSAVDRLRREAIAMARLAHPNVVTVFEVGELAGRAYVAMEYVPGTTLRGWLAEPRTRREILAMLRAIGAGLAAAHEAGIVHRDFKPDNVLVGRDGRARVGDFGLARDAGVAEPAEPATVFTEGLTQTGTVMGTPGYMAPEQMRGKPVDARADQFAFCVVAWEALFGARPFAQTDERTRLAAIESGALEVARSGRTARIQDTLARGLAAEAGARYASMDELLAELADRPPWRAIAIGAGALGVIAIVTWQLAKPEPRTCAGAGDEIATIDSPLEFAQAYRSAATTACRARLSGGWSDDLARRSRTCLDLQRHVAARIARTALPDPSACADAARLEAMPRTVSAAALEARAALVVAGHELATAPQTIARIAASPIASDSFVAPRLALVRGQLALVTDDVDGAETLQLQAFVMARAAGDGETTLLASEAIITTAGRVRRDGVLVAAAIASGIEDAERLAKQSPEAAARVYLAAAAVTFELVEPDTDGPRQPVIDPLVRAAAWVAKALELLPETRPSAIRIAGLQLRGTVHGAAGRRDDASADFTRARELARSFHGADHPRLAQLAAETTAELMRIGRTDEAAEHAREAARILALHPKPSIELARAHVALGIARIERGDRARGIEQLELARAQLAKLAGARGELAAVDVDLALAYLDDQRPADAIARLLEALPIQEAERAPTHPDLAATHYNLAVALRDRGQPADALDHALAAHKLFRTGSDRHIFATTLCAELANRTGDHARALAWTAALIEVTTAGDPEVMAWPRLERARALLATRGDRAEARRLLAQARVVYESLHRTARITEIDQLVRTARMPPL